MVPIIPPLIWETFAHSEMKYKLRIFKIGNISNSLIPLVKLLTIANFMRNCELI